MNTITTREQTRLESLELVIKQGRDSFLAVGMALAQINRDKLYRAEFDSFEEYLDKRWDISKSHGYRLIAFAKDVEVSPVGDTPKTEHESRKRREPALALPEKVAASVASEPTSTPDDDDYEEQPHIVQHTPEEIIHEVAARVEPAVTEYYTRLESLTMESLSDATDKQLASMSVFAAMIPKLIKDELRRRSVK